jgi:hypothetical protein
VVAASLGVIYSLVVRSIIRGLDEATERKS